MEMTSNQPYLFRAIYDWIVDNGATPYVLVDATGEHVKVPPQSIQNGQIVLNIAPRAVINYHADETAVTFSARFSGVAQNIYIPIEHIHAIYAAENGQGMVFSHEFETNEAAETNDEPTLSDVSADNTEAEELTEQASDTNATQSEAEKTEKGKKSKPFLKVIK